MRALVIGLALLTSGCAGYQARFEAAKQAQAARIAATDDEHCRSLGAAPGSTAYVFCRQSTSNNREAADESQRQAWLGVAQTGFNAMATQPPAPQPPRPNDHVCVAANNVLYRC